LNLKQLGDSVFPFRRSDRIKMQTTNGSDSTLATSGATPPNQQTPPPPQQWQQQQQQQWMAAMQYPPAAAMMMMQQQQMLMYPHQYVPYNQGPYQQHHPQLHQYGSYQQHQHQQHKAIDRGSGDDVKTLWVGDLLHWMDETYLHSCFSHTGEVLSCSLVLCFGFRLLLVNMVKNSSFLQIIDMFLCFDSLLNQVAILKN